MGNQRETHTTPLRSTGPQERSPWSSAQPSQQSLSWPYSEGPPLSQLLLTLSSALIPWLHLLFKGVTKPSQEACGKLRMEV